MFNIQPKDFYQFEFLRVLGTAPTHGCDVGECLEVAGKIQGGDGESWYSAWSEVASRAELEAKKAVESGDTEAARWAFLRAANYWRSSESMLRPLEPQDDHRRLDSISRSVENHKKACRLLKTPVKLLQVPYGRDESEYLPAYLYFPDDHLKPDQRDDDNSHNDTRNKSGKIPVLVQVQGYDTTQEEFYHFTVAGALPRGYAVLTFDGPGQGMVIRRGGDDAKDRLKRLYMRPDFEVVINAVLDALWLYAESPSYPAGYRELDLDRGVALLGNSLGAYFALRGAALESSAPFVSKIYDGSSDHTHERSQQGRVSACVALDGFYDVGAPARAHIPALLRRDFKSSFGKRAVNWVMKSALRMSGDPRARWEACHGMFVLGVSTPMEAVAKMQEFTLDEKDKEGASILDKVTCPTLVSDAKDSLFPIEAQRIYDRLSQLDEGQNGKTMWRPEGVGEGSLQAKVAAFSKAYATVFGWLDGVFERRAEDLSDTVLATELTVEGQGFC